MKPLFIGIATTLLALGTASAQRFERTFERTLNLSGPVNLDIETDSGGIQVIAGPEGAVRIRGILKANQGWLRSSDVEDRIRRLESNPPVEQTGNTVRVGHVS